MIAPATAPPSAVPPAAGRPRRRFQHALKLLQLPDQRRAPRYPCCVPLEIQNVALVNPWHDAAVAVDVSRLGVGLVGGGWLEPGTFLVLRSIGHTLLPKPTVIKVVRVQPLDRGNCLLGAVWLRPLGDWELDSLLARTVSETA